MRTIILYRYSCMHHEAEACDLWHTRLGYCRCCHVAAICSCHADMGWDEKFRLHERPRPPRRTCGARSLAHSLLANECVASAWGALRARVPSRGMSDTTAQRGNSLAAQRSGQSAGRAPRTVYNTIRLCTIQIIPYKLREYSNVPGIISYYSCMHILL